MSELTAEEIESVRQRLKSQLDELLECDALWRNKLTRDILDGAREQAEGNRYVLVNEEGRYYHEQIADNYRFLLRDLIATGMVRELMIAWANQPASCTGP